MANTDLFRSARLPVADTTNSAGGLSHALQPREALAQLAGTGTLRQTYYASAKEQLDEALKTARECDPAWVAKVARYARKRGYMKDLPVLLAAYLAKHDAVQFDAIAADVIDNGRQVRTLVQMLQSGALGSKSLPHCVRRYLRKWLVERKPAQLFRESVGKHPSIRDVIRVVHPKPTSPHQALLYGYLTGRNTITAPEISPIREFEAFKRDQSQPLPRGIEFRLLTGLPLTAEHWRQIAIDAPWHMLRMNLNTFARHGVWSDPEIVRLCADRLANAEIIGKVKAMPYQLLAAYLNATHDVPRRLTNALQDAAEIATANVPTLEGDVVMVPDVSGSMSDPVTGTARGVSSKVRRIDVAALVTACVVRKNPDALVLPTDTQVYRAMVNPRDSIMTIASTLAKFGGGGTHLSLALQGLLTNRHKARTVWIVSDNESWLDRGYYGATGLSKAWDEYRRYVSPGARLICHDLAPNTYTQAPNRDNTLNVGGYSDAVFDVVAAFSRDTDWCSVIESDL